MEDPQLKVNFLNRVKEMTQVFPEIDWTPEKIDYIALQVENAYIAGANGLNISEGYRGTFEMKDTGPYKVLAGNYAKDKGFRL